jgi:hypothetical protein
MILFIAKIVVLVGGGFVAGVLVGRRNKTLVEKAVTDVKSVGTAASTVVDTIKK